MFRKCLNNLSSTQTHNIPSCRFSRTNLLQIKNHYDVLGLTPKATQSDIKAAYYKLSMQYHPDKNKGSDDAAKKFRDITAAYEVLGTYRLRKLYDKGFLESFPECFEFLSISYCFQVSFSQPLDPFTRQNLNSKAQ